MVAADFAFVGNAGETAGTGENAEERKLGKADRGRAIIDENNFVACEGEFIAASGTRAIERGEKFQAGVRAGVFDAVARFVGELAEIDFPGVRRETQHVDVGARTE